ncbi:Rrf2 family transcriptional regulator [Thermosulfuriphilus ammonigenes]|uniref:Rrf2 family transcriptional regulator n=1 Tax=Thermosulfuriphilus ammonigenes TaxID=1936021 RepID=A0A6G7PZC3_9BACT|nr:Rrf2 family transcriptional regulator [Thermosulfuriphilus ammonigenes]MBA2849069.1 Rrf2 family protein [Thermosulfuriphilus ammonigenes]QIJ72753.1 Rrf2 family transcriptional regulator [Thermosulfuriphilus ammonigenes]
MRLTRAGEYAIRCILYLAGQSPGRVVSRKEVARAMEIPDPFLAKIAQQLSLAGIIEILQGARGGYRLLKDPAALSLLEVVEAVSGEIFLNECVIRPESCSRSQVCPVHNVWEKARRRLRETLQEATFDKLLAESRGQKI